MENKENIDIKEIVNDAITHFYNNMPQNQHEHPSQETIKMINDLNGKVDKIGGDISGEFGIINTLRDVLIQTKKTNGRVNSLENWKGYMTGGLAVLILLFTVLAPIIFTQIQDTNNRVATALLNK